MWDNVYQNVSSLPWQEADWVNACSAELKKHLSSHKGSKLLDFACGTGVYVDLYFDIGFHNVTGIDISSVAIDRCRHIYGKKYDESVSFIQGDVPVCTHDKYDAIVFWATIHHISPDAREGYIKAFADILSDSGVFIIGGWGKTEQRFRNGVNQAVSPIIGEQTWPIDGIDSLLDRYFDVDTRSHVNYPSRNGFDYYVCKKKMDIVTRFENDIIQCLGKFIDRIYFFHLVKYSIGNDLTVATMNQNESFVYYRNLDEFLAIFKRFMDQLYDKLGSISFTTDVYGMSRKKNLFASFYKSSDALTVHEDPFCVNYAFHKKDNTNAVTTDSHFAPAKQERFQKMSVKEQYITMGKMKQFYFSGRDYSEIQPQNGMAATAVFSEKLYYALHGENDLFFYYFVNPSFEIRNMEIGDGGLILYTSFKLNRSELEEINICFLKWSASLSVKSFMDKVQQEATKSAIAAIMSRNMSHNLGSHVITNAKHQIEDLENRQDDDTVREQLKGLSALMQYLQERQDFIAVIANSEHYPKGPLHFKNAVFDILAMDGPSHRHDLTTKVNNYILDNIVRSENVTRHGSHSADAHSDAIAIELQLVRVDAAGKTTAFKSMGESEIGNEFSDIVLSVNNGLNGRQALLTILENIIRNSAKHDKAALRRLDNNTLLFSVIFKECKDKDTGNVFYEITIADNKKNFATLKQKFEKSDGINAPIIRDGKLAPLQILREDGGGIARDNKGLKEILISLTWLKYGEPGKSGNIEIDYDTLQNAPWEILDVVGVDDRFNVYDFNTPGQPTDLSLGYRFRLDKYKSVHLLSADELDIGKKPLKEILSDLPGASLYAVHKNDYDREPNNKVLLAIPRFEIVADDATEESLQGKLDDLFEDNIKRRFGEDKLPLLRISENVSHKYDDCDAVVRDLLGIGGDRNWESKYSGKDFIHYRTHYETVLPNAKGEAELDLKDSAVFTEGISGGNFTNNLIRTAINRRSYLGIVEAALTQIAIVDERIFAKCAGRSPKQKRENPGEPDNPLWKYWEQKGVHILNSDENGIFDLRGYYVSTGVNASIEYDFLSIHLGLIDKTEAGENSSEEERLKKTLTQFGARYVPGKTKLSIHSGRGGMTQVEDIAFIPLSGIEWALDNCKYTLSEFFHGIKYPPFGDTAQIKPQIYQAKPRKREDVSPASTARNSSVAVRSRDSFREAVQPPKANARKVFLFTTYTTEKSCLYGTATDTIENPGIEKFASWETIHAKAPMVAEHFRRIVHRDSQFFFYPCTKPDNRVLIPHERHSEFVHHLVDKILKTASNREPVDLHLILHASDTTQRRTPNTKDTSHPLIEEIKQTNAGKVADVTIWWFSHDGTGIHGNIVCDGRLFDGVTDKALHLLTELARHTNTLPPVHATTATKVSPVFNRHRQKTIEPIDERDVCAVLRVPEGFYLNNKTYLDRLAIWQLSGATDQSALDDVLRASGDGKAFWDPRFSPDRCAERIKVPKPLLIIGPKPLSEFGNAERRANYLDSSIWCRYASNEHEAANIRKQFACYRELGLYDCNNGLEYLEFRARVLINSRFGEFDSSGHRKISPIVFHSEGEMAEKTATDVRSLKEAFTGRLSLNRPLIWKILLVDDHSREHLSGGKCSKLNVICDLLSSMFSIEEFIDGKYVSYPSKTAPDLDGLCHVKIHCAATIEEAMILIKEQHFDIILLDYLLNKEGKTTATESDFDTSDKLLEKIKGSTNESERGPMGYLWVFNVSAFASAIEGKLAAKGFHYHTNEWHLSRGACPINTPELFKYNLFSFMTWQVDELSKFHQKKMSHEYKGGVSLIDLLNKIFMSAEKTERQMADEYFRSILNFEAACKIMSKDIRHGLSDEEAEDTERLRANPRKSELVFSLFPDIIYYNKAFWDHLSHLIHTTAYGTPQQWPQMLINFREIKNKLVDANKGRNELAAKELVKKIEEFIICLNSRQ